MHVIVILQMAEALLVIMDPTFLDSFENGSKSYGPRGHTETFRRQETCLHLENHEKGGKKRRDKVREGFREGLTLGLRQHGSQVGNDWHIQR